MAGLMAYHWPGNVRELEHCIERAVILSQEPELQPPLAALPHPQALIVGRGPRGPPCRDAQRRRTGAHPAHARGDPLGDQRFRGRCRPTRPETHHATGPGEAAGHRAAALPESIVPTVVWAGSQNRHSAPPSGWFEAVMPLPSWISMRCGWSMAGLRLGCEFASPDIEDKCYTKR